MENEEVKEISTTDKDAGIMKGNNQGTDVSYNVLNENKGLYK